jgi:pilus assembly protein CpaE
MPDFDKFLGFPISPFEESQSMRGVAPASAAAYAPYLESPYPDHIGVERMMISIIGPDDHRRSALALAIAGCSGAIVREFHTYPSSLDGVPGLLEGNCDVLVIDLDSFPEFALELVEAICARSQKTVMVYSGKSDPELLVRCMRAGVREFLSPPFAHAAVAEAMVRAAARRPTNRPQKQANGRLLVFLGSKGGCGVTTLASNFAVALAMNSDESTILIDLDLPLGDVALNLGIVTEFSTVNALEEAARLDANFLGKLLVKHSSGLTVLAAPGRFPQYHATNEAIDKLLMVARQEFNNVVVDVGSRLDLTGTSLFKDAFTVYLVTQASIPDLRNSNRLISQFFTGGGPKLDIVVNRFDPRSMGVGEEHVTKALTRPPTWKIPNDFAAVRQMQNTATPLALADSPISRLIRQMARAVSGQAPEPEPQKKKVFGIF